jgi:hypothetical protein
VCRLPHPIALPEFHTDSDGRLNVEINRSGPLPVSSHSRLNVLVGAMYKAIAEAGH